MSELIGQMALDLGAVQEATASTGDGWDADGNLINPEVGDRSLAVIAAEINAIRTHTQGVLISAALEVGKRLIEARSHCPKGRWGEWLENSVDYSERKAQDLMRFYEEYGRGTMPEAIAALDYTRALLLLTAPEEDREALAARAAEEDLSSRELKKEIDELKRQRQEDNIKIYDLIQGQEDRDRKLEAAQAEIEGASMAAASEKEKAEAAEGRMQDALERAKKAEQKARDAKKALGDAQGELARVQAELERAQSAAPEQVEVMPEGVAEELEALREQVKAAEAEAARLRAGADVEAREAEKKMLAAALQIRMTVKGAYKLLMEAIRQAETEGIMARAAVAKLRGVDPEKAELLGGEVEKLDGWIAAMKVGKPEGW